MPRSSACIAATPLREQQTVRALSPLALLCIVLAQLIGVTPAHALGLAASGSGQPLLPHQGLTSSTPPQNASSNITYHNGPVMHSTTTHVIFWLPAGYHFETAKDNNAANATDAAYESSIKQFFKDVGATSLYGILTQYYDVNQTSQTQGSITNTSSFGGFWIDTTGYTQPGNSTYPIVDSDIQASISRALTKNNSWSVGPSQIYFVYTAYGIRFCTKTINGLCNGAAGTDNDCAYHGSNDQGLIYGYVASTETDHHTCAMNYSGGWPHDIGVDSAISWTSHELSEAVTDPYVTATGTCTVTKYCANPAWFTTVGTYSGEIGDLCESGNPGYNVALHGHSYIVQPEWSNASSTSTSTGCVLGYTPPLAVSLSANPSTTVALKKVVTLTGTANQVLATGDRISVWDTTANKSLCASTSQSCTSQGQSYTKTTARTYIAKVTAGSTVLAQSGQITVTWGGSTGSPPAAPTNIQASATDAHTIQTTWQSNSTNQTGFHVSDGAHTWAVGAGTMSYADGNLVPGTRKCYEVQAYNAVGTSSWDSWACATTPTPPSDPANVAASNVDQHDLQVSWTDPGGDASGYYVYDGTNELNVGKTLSYTDSNLPYSTRKCYWVLAYNGNGYSNWIGPSCAITSPSDPANLQAVPQDANTIQVSWNDPGGDANGYLLWDGTNSQNVGEALSYTDANLAPGTQKCYQVLAYNSGGYSNWTSPVCATTPSPPSDPTDIAAWTTDSTDATISWSDPGGDAAGFTVSDGTTTWDAGNSLSYSVANLSPGSRYCYEVQAYNDAGYSNWVGWACVTPPYPPSISDVYGNDSTDITVAWDDPNGDATGYSVSDGTNTWDVTDPSITNITISGLHPGQRYCYDVQAYNDSGDSDWTKWECANTVTAPDDLSVGALNNNSIQISWDDPGGDATAYLVTDGTNQWDVTNGTSFVDSDLAAGQYKCYSVYAHDDNWDYSNSIGPACTSTLTTTPGGEWDYPQNNDTVRTDIGFGGWAYPTYDTDPSIDHVDFTAWWPGLGPESEPWVTLCTAYPNGYDYYVTCAGDLSTFNAPAGWIKVSFNVYDTLGDVNLAPQGVHDVYYEPGAVYGAPSKPHGRLSGRLWPSTSTDWFQLGSLYRSTSISPLSSRMHAKLVTFARGSISG